MRVRHLPIAVVVLCLSALNPGRPVTAEPPPDVAGLKAGRYTIGPGPNVQYELQDRLIQAVPGDVIELQAGKYEFETELNLAADNVTLRGAGPDKTILSFAKQLAGSHGLEATGDNLVIERLAVENTAGDAIKVLGAANVTFRHVRAEWTGEASSQNGAYGLYPVQCRNVLIEDCLVRGASDAGIYVGQSQDVVVRRCRAEGNVAGIEIENTLRADVYDNVATDNSGGILAFDLPGLPVANGGDIRVFRNKIVANNHKNFAAEGAIVSEVPPGTGLMLMAADRVEVFDNDIGDNQTANLLVISYLSTLRKLKPTAYDPYPESIWIHDNRFAAGGQKPGGTLGTALKALLGVPFPDVFYDGLTDKKKFQGDALPEALSLRLSDNGKIAFANVHFDAFNPENVLTGKYKIDRDLAAHVGRGASVKPVTLEPHAPPELARDPAILTYRSVPKRLSDYRLFEGKLSEQKPTEGLLAYDLNTPLFSDYAAKHRFVQLPTGAAMNYADDGVFSFPMGTTIVKTFAMPKDMRNEPSGERLLETRIELLKPNGWYGFSYVWNDEQTDAFLALGGAAVETTWIDANGQQAANRYRVPNANQCLSCHGQDGKFAPIGTTAGNLNRALPGEHGGENQLAAWSRQGKLHGLTSLDATPKTPVYDDPHSGTVERRARAWLDVNCAHCHQPAGSARTTGLDLRLSQIEPSKFGVFKSPVAAGRSSSGKKYDIVPGKPDESILLHRVASSEPGVSMPNLSRNLVHKESLPLLRQWIAEMTSSPQAAGTEAAKE